MNTHSATCAARTTVHPLERAATARAARFTASLTANPAASENPTSRCGRYTGTLLLMNAAKMKAPPTARISRRSGPLRTRPPGASVVYARHDDAEDEGEDADNRRQLKRPQQRVRHRVRDQAEVPPAVALGFERDLMQHERRPPPRHAIRREVSDLLLDVVPSNQHHAEVRAKREGQTAGHSVPVGNDQRSRSVVEDVPRRENQPGPERVAMTQHGETDAGARAHKPAFARPLAAEQIRGQRSGDEEDRRDIRARIADAAEKIAVQREKQRGARVRSSNRSCAGLSRRPSRRCPGRARRRAGAPEECRRRTAPSRGPPGTRIPPAADTRGGGRASAGSESRSASPDRRAPSATARPRSRAGSW